METVRAVRHSHRCAESSTVYPIYDQADMWHLQECYIGYQIDAEEARKRYFVKAEGVGGEVIYLEHWTRETYQIRIGNEIAKRKWAMNWFRWRDRMILGASPSSTSPTIARMTFMATATSPT